ncbi:MAG: ABC transporter permease [Deltaproteobacteria bacterium]|nr:ABC transporter permease [Deltaproteobacteria bacterium]
MGRRIWQMMKKEFIQVWRDRRLRIFLILPPIIQLIIYGYAINFDIRQVPFGVFDEDRSQASELLISRFTASEYFLLTDSINSEAELKGLIDRSRITLAVHIPRGFAAKIKANQPVPLQLILDATDSNTALIVAKYTRTILNDYAQEMLQQTLRHLNLPKKLQTPVVIEPRAWLNPNLESKNAFVPGVVAMVVMLVSLMLTALSVVREREIGTMAQILVSPLSPLEFLSGKTIPFILISLVDVALVTLMGVFWFEIPFQGSVAVLFIGTLAFLLSSVGLGLLISTTCSTQQQAVMAGTFVLTPSILLSGLIFPIANMAVIFQYITYVNPLRYFIVIVQGVFLGGRSLEALWPQMAAMAGLGVVFLGLSIIRFRGRLA